MFEQQLFIELHDSLPLDSDYECKLCFSWNIVVTNSSGLSLKSDLIFLSPPVLSDILLCSLEYVLASLLSEL